MEVQAEPIKQERPSQPSQKQEPVKLYHQVPAIGTHIGNLEIPRIKAVLPIIQGANEDELEKGVGHVYETALPGESDTVLLAGHRDTVFKRLGEVKVGDLLIVKTRAGTFTYQVKGAKIVSKNDRSIKSTYPHPHLVVSTCYPFGYIGPAPQRYLLMADLVRDR
ncbi:class D sortase [Thermoactinomyces sp. CICC 10521]|uniref:class D sortase n=1 Tax=Thermoactinomyces sp. CICC 10521 TaxID=2767426 RepID=UPI001E471DB6|nr:class D sortase [Thermoactinomyces sp. CICC 10521]